MKMQKIGASIGVGLGVLLCFFLLTAASGIALSTPEAPIDLAKIDRSISKEPVYQSKSPKYALLVFGPKADENAR